MPIRKPGKVSPRGNWIHVPVAQHHGQWAIRTIDIDPDKGIKALVEVVPKTAQGPQGGRTRTLSFLFDANQWDMRRAQRWVYTHLTKDQKKLKHFQHFPKKPLRVKGALDNLDTDQFGFPAGMDISGMPGGVPWMNHVVRANVTCASCGQAFASDIHALFYNLPNEYVQSPPEYWAPLVGQDLVEGGSGIDIDDPGQPQHDAEAQDVGQDPITDSMAEPEDDTLDEGTLGGPVGYRIGSGPLDAVLVGMGSRYCPACEERVRRRGVATDFDLYRQYEIHYNNGLVHRIIAVNEGEE